METQGTYVEKFSTLEQTAYYRFEENDKYQTDEVDKVVATAQI